jgi:hypothetical protein
MMEPIYFILGILALVVSGVIYFRIEDSLQKYFKKDVQYGGFWFSVIPIIIHPENYFKKESIIQGYFAFIGKIALTFIMAIILFYLLNKISSVAFCCYTFFKNGRS